MYRRILFTLSLIAASLNSAHANDAAAAKTTYTLGIVPQQSIAELAKDWTPVVVYLSKKTGYNLQFTSAKDIPTFEKRLATGDYDFAYMNPYHYTVFNKAPGYRAVAKELNKKLKGVIVVRKDATYAGLAALSGSPIAFPGPASFAATVLPQAEMRKLDISFTPTYVSSHDSVYLAVARGLYPAGGGVMKTLEGMPQEVQDQLKILWTTPVYTPHPIAAHPRIPEDVAEKLLEALAGMHTDPEAAKLLEAINFKGFERARDKEFDDVRKLNIQVLAPAK
jgi:phosphonate transport system substrate-binding protein